MASTIVIALGGNALQSNGMPATAEAQLKAVEETASYIADIIEQGNNVVITHGNGPQVGRLLLAGEYAAKITPSMPFDVCGAMSQGYIGYHIQQVLGNVLRKRGIRKPVATIITQSMVNEHDEAFKTPTKPIGPFYTEEEANKISVTKGYTMKEDAGRGWRRVVPSPEVQKIVELDSIKDLIETGAIVICVGGGGIPVIKNDKGNYTGVAAVIDKDLGSENLAEEIGADIFLILTAVEQVAINFNKANQKVLDFMTVNEGEKYIQDGQFAPGSMLPKIKAALRFVNSKPGRKAIITSLERAKDAIEGKAGTTVIASSTENTEQPLIRLSL